MKCEVTICVFCGASLPVSSNNKKYEEHLQDWHNITIYQEVETAMDRSRVRESGIHGEKDGVKELCETEGIIIQDDTAADGEDFVTVQEEFIEEEDCFEKTNTVTKEVEEVNKAWKEVVAKKAEELECLTKKLEDHRKDKEEELKIWKIKEDENAIEREKDKEEMVQLRKTVEELKEEIRKERVVKKKEKKKLSEEKEREIKRKKKEDQKEEVIWHLERYLEEFREEILMEVSLFKDKIRYVEELKRAIAVGKGRIWREMLRRE